MAVNFDGWWEEQCWAEVARPEGKPMARKAFEAGYTARVEEEHDEVDTEFEDMWSEQLKHKMTNDEDKYPYRSTD